MTKRYIVTKSFEPEGAYQASLSSLAFHEEEDLAPGLPAVVKRRYLNEHEVNEVRARPHVIGVEEDVHDQALMGYGGFDEGALAFHQLSAAAQSGWRGKGVRVAVLDTGINGQTATEHFGGRLVGARSFVPGEEVEDGNGHGDFCAVAACPDDAELLVGKVLSNEGSGARSGIIEGMSWAVAQGAHIISMSLGGSGSSAAYDATIRAAKAQGCLVFAAAGNDGRENGPVNCPGNAVDAYAVAAINHRSGQIADFSCKGPEVDFCAAGVGINYKGKGWSGTSMATPLAARCYATLRGQTNDWRDAYKAFLTSLKDTPAPSTDDGAGYPLVTVGMPKLPVVGPPGPPPDKPEPTKPELPSITFLSFIAHGVKERSVVTKSRKPWVIAEPVA